MGQKVLHEIDSVVQVIAKVTILGWSYLKYNYVPGGKMAQLQTIAYWSLWHAGDSSSGQ